MLRVLIALTWYSMTLHAARAMTLN